MRFGVTNDVHEFWQRAEDFLTADPVANTLPLTIAAQRLDGSVVDAAVPTFGTVHDDAGAVVGVFGRTPPRGAFITQMPLDAVAAAVDGMRASVPRLPGVVGAAPVAARFAELWCADGAAGYVVERDERLHALGELQPPVGVPGEQRLADSSTLQLLTDWGRAFELEVGKEQPSTTVDAVRLGVLDQRLHLWCVRDEPVSYVGHAPPVAGVARVAPVYTPPEHRGNGYASALVAEVSRRLLAGGVTDVCLYTDLANPTSNKIYAAVGYEPVFDVTQYAFTYPPMG